MSTAAQIPMMDKSGNPGMVDSSKAADALASGYEPAIKMIGPDGNQGYVAQSKVDAARSSKFAIAPDSGVPMVTPKGEMTFALPNEVEKFEQSGHTLIKPDGSFEVKPLEGEANTDTMDRAARVVKAMTPEMKQKAIDAEAKTFTAKRIAASLVAGPAAGAATLGVLAAPAAISAGATALNASPAAISVGTALGKAMGSPTGQMILKQVGKKAIGTAGTIIGSYGAAKLGAALGVKWLQRLLD